MVCGVLWPPSGALGCQWLEPQVRILFPEAGLNWGPRSGIGSCLLESGVSSLGSVVQGLQLDMKSKIESQAGSQP